MPKQHFVGIKLFIIEVGGKLIEQAPVFFSFFSHFLTSQTPSEDDNSEDEWQMKVSHVVNVGIH